MKFVLKLIADLSFYATLVPALIALAMITGFSPPFFVWFIPPAVYIVYAIVNYRIFSDDIKYKAAFMLYVKIFAVFAVFMIIGDSIDIFTTIITPIAMVFFVSSITLMRLSRHSDSVQSQLSYKLLSGGSVAALVVAAVLMSLFWASGLMRTVLLFLYHRVGVVILMAVVHVVIFIMSPLVEWLLGIDLSPQEEYTIPDDLAYGEYSGDGGALSEADPLHFAAAFGIIIAIILLAIILRVLFKILTHRPVQLKGEAGVEQEYVAIEGRKQQTVKQKNRVRRYYQRFLAVCKKRGIPVEPRFTTDTYNKMASEKFGEEEGLNKFREIYLPVRYGGDAKENAAQEDIDFVKKFVAKLRRMRKP